MRVEEVGVSLILQTEADRGEVLSGGVRVDIQVGGRRGGVQLVPGQPGVPSGGHHPQSGQLGFTAALD